MKIRFSQLKAYLNKSSISVLLVSGDEPYQHMLAADMFRAHYRKLGFSERKILSAETGFDWSELELAKNNLSLFDNQTLIDLRIPSGKPGINGSKAIVNFVDNLHQDVKLLVLVPKLDRNVMSSAWVKAIDKVGAVLRIWPLNEQETKDWIKSKLESKEFSVTNSVISFISQHVEGNLLAAMQEIEKIALICKSKELDMQEVNAAVINSSHYSLNELMDSVLNKDLPRLVRILDGLEKEDVALPLLLWGLTEQIRTMVETGHTVLDRTPLLEHPLAQLCNTHQKNIDVCSEVHNNKYANLLKQCAWTDRVIKGRANSNPWHELLQLSIATQIAS